MKKASEIRAFGNRSTMIGVEIILKYAADYLRKQKAQKAQLTAEQLEFVLWELKVMLPDLFDGPCPESFNTPLLDKYD